MRKFLKSFLNFSHIPFRKSTNTYASAPFHICITKYKSYVFLRTPSNYLNKTQSPAKTSPMSRLSILYVDLISGPFRGIHISIDEIFIEIFYRKYHTAVDKIHSLFKFGCKSEYVVVTTYKNQNTYHHLMAFRP